MSKKTIMVVDDNESWLKVIDSLLRWNYELSFFTSVDDAKLAFGKEHYDLIILDKNLGTHSGLELLRDLRQSRPAIRAIMLTEFADIESAVNSMKLGALDYVSKLTPNLKDVLLAKVNEALTSSAEESQIRSLINQGESSFLEFKSSMRWDFRRDKINKDVERTIVKTIASFMNAESESTMLIGVSDQGTVVGLTNDYKTLGQKQDRDSFETYLTSRVLEACGSDCAPFMKVTFHNLDNHEICQVTITPSPKPVFVKDDRGEHFYVRTGNSTRLLTTREAIEYHKLRWKS